MSANNWIVPRWPAPANVRALCTTRNGGVSGVPFFIFNRKLAVSGAHESETLLKAMLESIAR